jgi:hypothetical protein
MPRRARMFPGITRQVVISDDTHRLLRKAAERENKYIGELADELIRAALAQRYPPSEPTPRQP